ncbi:CoA pyrophosphatase [Candidatus Colwellia aromaticivorans]|uniref:CoA pyrophosphatase n=1 Tax=Candidatus Colwellia aromaticivorans TaxID=2267621 RepID=UPI000DF16EA6|nr:CoA pyrophosphatase [Candidatus Colwellia aromaticivorans]
MNKEEFLYRFNLLQHGDSCHNYQHHSTLKSAAVLIALVNHSNTGEINANGLHVLLTRRASHLKHHPSQISFPGGKVEPTDKNVIHTALREAQEEIGLSPDSVSIVGQLPNYEIISGYQVTPIVAIIESPQYYQKDANEVDEIFQVPLQHFLQPQNHRTINSYHNGRYHNVHFFPYKHYNIWGATAAMLKDLVEHIK